MVEEQATASSQMTRGRAQSRWLRSTLKFGYRCVQLATNAFRGLTFGRCPICGVTVFYKQGPWLRDQFRCARCYSIPRWRALVHVLDRVRPDWRDLHVHESSPGGAASVKLARECRGYEPTNYWPDTPPGEFRETVRCENLESQTFPDECFDVVVTQDVLEHVFDAESAFREIARTLKPGGVHVFTVPWYHWRNTRVRAELRGGELVHLEVPDYHGNPIDENGSLVVREWGSDLPDFVHEASGLSTTVYWIDDVRRGIRAEFIEVFVSRKPGESKSR